jgi:hypothetical protein
MHIFKLRKLKRSVNVNYIMSTKHSLHDDGCFSLRNHSVIGFILKLRGLSPPASYTDRATTASRRS